MRTTILIASVTILTTSIAQAQAIRGLAIQTGVSVSVPVGDPGFARAFGLGAAGSLGVVYNRATSWRPWFELELHMFTYDRHRFFERIGLRNVDLSTQLDAGTTTWTAMVGVDLMPWRLSWLEPYLRGGIGYLSRDNGAAPILIYQYCTPAMVISESYIGPDLDFVAPEFCTDARAEVGDDIRGLGVQVGAGVTVAVDRLVTGFVDVRVVRPGSSGELTLMLLRLGVMIHR